MLYKTPCFTLSNTNEIIAAITMVFTSNQSNAVYVNLFPILMKSIRSDDLQMVVSLLTQWPALANQIDENMWSPLLLAVCEENLLIVKYLVSAFPRIINKRNLLNRDAIGLAVMHNCVEIAQCLIDAGASLEQLDMDGRTPLLIAAKEGLVDLVIMLLAYGANPHVVDSYGNGVDDLLRLHNETEWSDLSEQED